MDSRLIDYLSSIGADPSSLDGWTVRTAQRDGEDCGFVLTAGPEIHILPLVPGKSISRRNIIEHVGKLLAQFGYVTTRVPLAETDHRLRTALGFEHAWDDAQCSYWCMTRLRFAHTQQGDILCQSPS